MEQQNNRADDKAKPNEASAPRGQPTNIQEPIPLVSVAGIGDAGDPTVHEPRGAGNAHPPPEDPPVEPTPTQPSNDRWITWLTAIIAVATAVNVIVFYLESESSSRDIKELASKAGEIVGSMNAALGDSRAAISKAFAENKEALDANATQSKKALDASIAVSRLDQRAWVGIKLFNLTPPEGGKLLRIELILTNTGKTVATVNSTIMSIHPTLGEENIGQFVASAYWQGQERRRSNAPRSPNVIFPNFDFTLPIFSPMPVEREQVPMIQEGRISIYVLGEIYYSDVFGRDHTTGFCVVYSPMDSRFKMCHEHNWAN